MLSHAKKRGVAGVVINGAVRDLAALRTGTIPVFAAGVTHRGPYKNGPGEINYPIAIDGMVIEPGDLVVEVGARLSQVDDGERASRAAAVAAVLAAWHLCALQCAPGQSEGAAGILQELRAFREMGDKEAALEELQDVLRDGDDALKTEAQELIDLLNAPAGG